MEGPKVGGEHTICRQGEALSSAKYLQYAPPVPGICNTMPRLETLLCLHGRAATQLCKLARSGALDQHEIILRKDCRGEKVIPFMVNATSC